MCSISLWVIIKTQNKRYDEQYGKIPKPLDSASCFFKMQVLTWYVDLTVYIERIITLKQKENFLARRLKVRPLLYV